MKFNIMYDFKDGPWGGANQFLKALKGDWIRKGCYENDPFMAQAIIVNSHHFTSRHMLFTILKLKLQGKVIVHRIDGPVSVVRGSDEGTDALIALFNRLFCDATVFQSQWSRNECYKKGIVVKPCEAVIINAPDTSVFFTTSRPVGVHGKTRLIATSWSANRKKGFDVYIFLDEHLDFDKYDFTFVGNAPGEFKHVKHIKPEGSGELARLLQAHDIFITASENDPCSNSLIEALTCGLPAVVLRSGGHPEIIGSGGETFSTSAESIGAIDKVANNLEEYRSRISVPSISDVGNRYLQLGELALRQHASVSALTIVLWIIYFVRIKFLAFTNKVRIHLPLLLRHFLKKA